MIEYFWETEYKFAQFLKKIFGDNYRRKYSLEGNGIYDLVTLNNKIYHIKYSSTRTMTKADNRIADADKQYIIETITNNLKNKNYATSGGKIITFSIGSWIAKVEIIKKINEPK